MKPKRHVSLTQTILDGRKELTPASNLEESPAVDEAILPARNWKLTLAYDGTGFHGWQVQPSQRTIQGELSSALQRICGERVLPQGSGRTDTGVHALGQVASCRLLAPIPPANLQRALNRALPAAIRVLAAEIAPDHFHARHSAVGKTYDYRIFRGEICPPFLARFVYALNWPLDIEAMSKASAYVVGEHDFSSFAATDPDVSTRNSVESGEPNCVRTIHESHWRVEGAELIYRVTGNGFLHHMVRNLVGTFLDAGRGAISPTAVPDVLAARARSAAGSKAPARGLVLVGVSYSADAPSRMLP